MSKAQKGANFQSDPLLMSFFTMLSNARLKWDRSACGDPAAPDFALTSPGALELRTLWLKQEPQQPISCQMIFESLTIAAVCFAYFSGKIQSRDQHPSPIRFGLKIFQKILEINAQKSIFPFFSLGKERKLCALHPQHHHNHHDSKHGQGQEVIQERQARRGRL